MQNDDKVQHIFVCDIKLLIIQKIQKYRRFSLTERCTKGVQMIDCSTFKKKKKILPALFEKKKN